MSEEKENEGVVIDVVPEPEPEPEQEPAAEETAQVASAEPEKPAEPAKPRSSIPALILAILSLVLIAGAAFIGMQRWSEVNHDLQTLNARFDATVQAQKNIQVAIDTANAAIKSQQLLMEKQRKEIAEQQSGLNKQIQGIASERRQMNLRETELKSLVADIHQRIGRSDSQWRVAEAGYLLRVAIERLQLAHDLDTARQALSLADARLKDTAEPQWDPVRQQIARDLTALGAVSLPDVPGISAQLSALSEQVPTLALADTAAVRASKVEKTTRRESRTWRTLVDDMFLGLKDSVRIRRSDEPIRAMLTPDQQHFLYQNLALQLETARLALIQEDPLAYKASLEKAKSWIEQLFDIEQQATAHMLESIDELLSTDIAPALPDITRSLTLLTERQTLNKVVGTDE